MAKKTSPKLAAKTVRIRCKGAGTIAIDMLKPIQGALKVLHEENYHKLKNEIADEGFKEPISIWEDPKSGKLFVLNGHQRLEVLTRMKAEGWTIPQVPVNFIEAEDMKEAKRSVLPLTSQYGVINPNSAFEYAVEVGVDREYVEKYLNFADFSTDRFLKEYFEQQTPTADVNAIIGESGETVTLPEREAQAPSRQSRAGEISQDDFQEFDHKCPRCSFEFNS